jgi:hypothetical protein
MPHLTTRREREKGGKRKREQARRKSWETNQMERLARGIMIPVL